MNNFNVDDQKTNQVVEIKDQICAKPWDEIKTNPDILKNAISISNNYEVDPASMLLSEKSYLLGEVFANSQMIDRKDSTEILGLLIKGEEDQNKIKKKYPELKTKNISNWDDLSKQISLTYNGLINVKHIAMLRFAESIILDVNLIKKLSPEQIKTLLSQAYLIRDEMQTYYDKTQEPPDELLVRVGAVLKQTGRSVLEIDGLLDNNDLINMILIFGKVIDALEIVKKAQDAKETDKLETTEGIVEILIQLNKDKLVIL